MLNLQLEIDGKTISANKIYRKSRYGKIYITKEAKDYRGRVKELMKEIEIGKYEGGEIEAYIEVYDNFYTKKNTIRKVDLDNSLKNLLDSIFPNLGIDDSTLFDLHLKKIHTEKPPLCKIHLKECAK